MSANTLSWWIIGILAVLGIAFILRFGKQILNRMNISLPKGDFDFPSSLSRSQAIPVAILLGLLWIPVTLFTGWLYTQEWFTSLFPTYFSWWEVVSVPRLLLGLPLCLLVAPLILRIKREDYDAFLRASGVTGFSRNGVLLTSIMVIGALVLTALTSGGDSLGQVFNVLNPFTQTWSWLTDFQPAIFEELLYRGIVLGLLLKYVKPWQAVVITSLLFGIIHLLLSGSSGMFIFVQSTLFSLFFFSILRLLTGAIWASVFVHFVGNTSALNIPLALAYLITLSVAFFLYYRRRRQVTSPQIDALN